MPEFAKPFLYGLAAERVSSDAFVPWKTRCKKCGPDFFVLHLPTKIWRTQFLRSNYTHTYRHDVMYYRLTKFYMGFRLIVVSLDKNVYVRVDDRLNIFRAFSPTALRRPAANIELIIVYHIANTGLFDSGY
jgi:hypothetical protein